MSAPSALLERLAEDAVWRLEEACCRFEQAWQAGGRPSLEDFLAAAQGAERRALLAELLRLDVYYRRRAGEIPAPHDYQTRFPDAADLPGEIFAAPDPLRPGQETVDDPQRTGPELPPSAGGAAEAAAAGGPVRFRVLRFLAAGGLGEVFVAEDTELHREVALKEIKRQYADRDESRGRFVLEGEITGGLEHPGIVPVYGLGTYPDGRPYYAMRFIRGETLAAAVQRFHAPAPVRFDSLECRQLLGRFVTVCQAVAYAHSRGVLHRDIKPGNIMLGKFGETLLVDWGLAKVVGQPEAVEAVPGEEGLLRPSGGGWAQTHGVVGTPAFMSPEQAAGKLAELGPATDVYSLGATLYALLTNRAPFQGPAGDVVRQVERGSWVPPRQVNGAVPAALDAICRKAMALRPGERYGSALDLAKDVEQWLGDEPVAAYSEPWSVRLRRWMRKHSRLVTVAAAVLVTAVVGLTVGTVLLERSNRRERDSRELAERQADYFIEEVCENLLLREPGMQQLRRQILLSVMEDYEKFLEKRPGDARARQQLAKAKRQLGEVYLEVERIDEARALVEQARDGYEQLLRESLADRELRLGMAQAHLALAELQVQSGEREEGKKEANRAIDFLERLKAEEPQNVRFLTRLARGYNVRATAETELGDLEAGVADNQRAYVCVLVVLSLRGANSERNAQNRPWQFETLITHYDPRDRIRSKLLAARTLTTTGMLLEMTGRTTESACVLREVPHLFPWLAESEARGTQTRSAPGPMGGAHDESKLASVDFGRSAEAWTPGELPPLKWRSQLRHGLSLALLHAGHAEVELGRPARAEPALRAALEGLREPVRDDALVQEYAANRLLASGYLGEDLFRSGRTVPAAALLREIGDQGDKVLGGPRGSRLLRVQQARLLHVLGRLEQETGDIDTGIGTHERAREMVEQSLRKAPADRSLQSDVLGNREALARCRFLRGDITRERWIDEQKEIVAKRRDLASQGPPRSPRSQGEFAASASLLASLLLEAGRPREALACIDAVLPSHEQFIRDEPLRAKDLTAAWDTPAKLEPLSTTITDDTYFFPFHASSMHKPLVPENLELRRRWADLLAQRGRALVQAGRGGEAVEPVLQAVRMTEELLRGDREVRCPPFSPATVWGFLAEELYRREPCYLYDLACYLALASTMDREAGIPDPAGGAVQALRDYVACGFDNPHKLRTDPALEPLRKRDDFQKLVRDLEATLQGRK